MLFVPQVIQHSGAGNLMHVVPCPGLKRLNEGQLLQFSIEGFGFAWGAVQQSSQNIGIKPVGHGGGPGGRLQVSRQAVQQIQSNQPGSLFWRAGRPKTA